MVKNKKPVHIQKKRSLASPGFFVLVVSCIISGLASFASASSEANSDCTLFEPWLQSVQNIPQGKVPANELQKPFQIESKLRGELAQKIFTHYLSGDLDPNLISKCTFGKKGFPDLKITLQDVFYQKSIEHLSKTAERSGLRSLQILIRLLRERTQNGAFALFRLIGHMKENEDEPAPYVAGTHRVTRSIYAKLGEIHPDEWFVFFIHELIHSLDSIQVEAISIYGQTALDVAQILQKDHPDSQDLQILDRWLIAGMNRSLLAEYRAWWATAVIYQEGKNIEGLWNEIPWFEKKLIEKGTPDQRLSERIYLVLDQNSEDPTEVLKVKDEESEKVLEIDFKHPLLVERLSQLRRELRSFEREVELGAIGEMIHARY